VRIKSTADLTPLLTLSKILIKNTKTNISRPDPFFPKFAQVCQVCDSRPLRISYSAPLVKMVCSSLTRLLSSWLCGSDIRIFFTCPLVRIVSTSPCIPKYECSALRSKLCPKYPHGGLTPANSKTVGARSTCEIAA